MKLFQLGRHSGPSSPVGHMEDVGAGAFSHREPCKAPSLCLLCDLYEHRSSEVHFPPIEVAEAGQDVQKLVT